MTGAFINKYRFFLAINSKKTFQRNVINICKTISMINGFEKEGWTNWESRKGLHSGNFFFSRYWKSAIDTFVNTFLIFQLFSHFQKYAKMGVKLYFYFRNFPGKMEFFLMFHVDN